MSKHIFQLQPINKIAKKYWKEHTWYWQFAFEILGMFLLPKVLYAAQENTRVWPNYKRSYVNIKKHSNIRQLTNKPIETIKIFM